jgi:antitoxin (DNA-binding transcriptional repressor) of toxin-antitoxin stability system
MTTSPSSEPTKFDIAFPPESVTIEVSISHARAHLPELLDQIRDGTTVYFSRYGKRIAALMPAAAGEYLERVEDEYWSARARKVLDAGELPVPWERAVAELEACDSSN